MVEFALSEVIAGEVLLVRSREKRAAVLQLRLDALLRGLALLHGAGRRGPGCRDARLFGLQLVRRDGIGVVGLQQLVGLSLQRREAAFSIDAFSMLAGEDDLDVRPDDSADVLGELVGQLDGLPVVGNQPLHGGGLGSDERAAVLQRLAAEAVEVLVVGTVPVAGYLVAEGFAALSAEDRPFQVVSADAWLLSALVA